MKHLPHAPRTVEIPAATRTALAAPCVYTDLTATCVCLPLWLFCVRRLGVDLFNKHVKDKMTKREFSRNNRSVLDDEHYDLAYLDRIYDNIKELGPIVHPRKELTAVDALAALT